MRRGDHDRVAPACAPGADGSCAVCGDEALPARVFAVDAALRAAWVEVRGAVVEIALDLVEGVGVGDTVLVHQGFAIARVDAA